MIKPRLESKGKKGSINRQERKGQQVYTSAGTQGLLNNKVLLIVIVLAITFIAFLPSLSNQFIKTWDDNVYITDNSVITHLNWESIRSFFTTQKNGTYVPLPLLSWAVEYKLFGLAPFSFHLDNLLLHLLCTLLVFYFFHLLRLPPVYAALGALIFGIHPMHVESVAWVTERKDLLFCLFYLGSLIAYVRFIVTKNRKLMFFLLTFLLFVLSLFSKIQAVSLPFSLLLIDYWFDRSLKLKTLYEKIPFFALSLIFGLAGYFILQNAGGIESKDPFSVFERLLFGLYSLSTYMFKLILPLNLSCYYPYPSATAKALPILYYLSPLFLVGISYLVFLSARKTKAVVFGSLFFLVNVIFLLQFVRAGEAFMADRFTYVSYIGLIFIAVWAINKLVDRNKSGRIIISGVLIVISAFFFTGTYARCKEWKDSITLWNDVISKFNNSPLAYDNRGIAFGEFGQWDKTIRDFSNAIVLDPKYTKAWYDRGVAYGNLERWDLATPDFSTAIALDPALTDAYSDRGNAYSKLGKWKEAIDDFSTAIRINPQNALAFYDRGNEYCNLGQWNNAINDYSKAIEIEPGYSLAWSNRGAVYGNLGQFEKAITDFSKALEIDPSNMKAYTNREIAYKKLGQEKNP
ncbi:MAG: tetratricopeptide repeat protein [Bacteroidales bacterium]|jgi:tetratricopeptide (TPR) repeat protein